MHFPAVLLTVLGFAIIGESATKISYAGYKVYRFIPQTEEQLSLLRGLQENNPGVIFWKEVSNVGQSVDIMYPPHLQGDLLEGMLELKALSPTEYIEDVQSLIDKESEANIQGGTPKFNWNSYGTLEDINIFLNEQVALHPDKASIETIGKTYEGRDLRILKISKPGNSNRKVIWIDANIHAREWITSAVSTWIINELLNSNDPEVVALTDDFDWFIMAMVNPDGYEYTRQTDRLWRKTRADTGSSLGCRGVDANKNFAYHWLGGGSSTNPCVDTFAGNEAFSENETRLVSEFYNRIGSRAVAYLTLHAYGQLILIPYGFSDARIPQYNEYMRIARATAEALAVKFNTVFTYGNVVEKSYVQSGGSMDWVKGVHNTNLTLWFELRDTGASGFILPPDQIIPSSQEFLDALLEIVSQIRGGIAGRVDSEDIPVKLTIKAVKPVDESCDAISGKEELSPIVPVLKRRNVELYGKPSLTRVSPTKKVGMD